MKNIESGAIVISNQSYDLNALGAIRSLGKEGVNVVWLTPDSSKWYYSKYCQPIICPDFKTDETSFIQFLIKLGKRRKKLRDVIIPTSDASLMVISKNKQVLEEYFRPMVCDWVITETFIDKSKIYSVAESLGVPVPKTFCPSDEDEVKQIACALNFPCLVKPAVSHTFAKKFKTKLFQVSSPSELLARYSILKSKGFIMMIQEEVPGDDKEVVTLNTVLNEFSEPLAIFMHRRVMQNPPFYGVVSLGESVWESKIIKPALKLLKEIGFQGVAQVEFKRDSRTGIYKLIEINGRSYLSISLPTACGLNLIHLAYRNALGVKIAPLKSYDCKYDLNVKWLDFPSYLESIIKLRRLRNVSLRACIRPILTKKITLAGFSNDDNAPFLMEINYIIKNLRKIVNTISAS